MTDRLVALLSDRGPRVLLIFGLVTAVFTGANIGLANDTEASQEPDAEIFDARDKIDQRLGPVTHTQFMLIESADGGDLLRAEPLAEIFANGQALREADNQGLLAPDGIEPQKLLAERFEPGSGARVDGFLNLAEVVALGVNEQFGVPLSEATDAMVKVVLAAILADPQTAGLSDQISAQATKETREVLGTEITVVDAPAIIFDVQAWNEPLGGGQFAIGPSADPIVQQKEAFNLKVEEYFRGEQKNIAVLAVAGAANETAEAQGETAAPYIVAAVVAAVLIVGLALRSYWATALTGAGLAVLMSWLGGISNLIGVEGGLVIDLLVPISMIALGVDFAVHSMAHYQQERAFGPRSAFRYGMSGVFGALLLAAATDSAAFLSNASSEIESIVDFAIAAAVGTVSSFIVLGIMAPLALSLIEEKVGPKPKIGRFRFSSHIATIQVAALSGAASIVTLAVSPLYGAALAVLLVVLCIAMRFNYARRHPTMVTEELHTHEIGSVARRIGNVVAALASRPAPLLLAVAGITGLSIYGALGLQGSFNISDFFAGNSDFVQSVERLPKHVGSRGGESNQILIEGDLNDPQAWAAINNFTLGLEDNAGLARDEDGMVMLFDPQPVEILADLTSTPDVVEATTGVRPVDSDGNGVPDQADQVAAVWTHALTNGVSDANGNELLSGAEIATVIDFSDDESDIVVFRVEVPDSDDFDKVRAAQAELKIDEQELITARPITNAITTGSGLGRLEVIDASTNALRTSLPIAVVVVFFVLLLGLRSLRYAIVTTVPMLLVAAWLYGTMALLGFDLNLVTATIGAISIGVGADYAIHMTERYRTERFRTDGHIDAARAAAESTGVALLASAGSTAVGFAILAFAPMPLFATFGLLTALMVIFALLASLVVLPPLLALASRNQPMDAIADRPRSGEDWDEWLSGEGLCSAESGSRGELVSSSA